MLTLVLATFLAAAGTAPGQGPPVSPARPGGSAIAAPAPIRFEAGSRLNHVGFTADGRTLVTVGQEGHLRLWNATTGARLGEATVQRPNTVCLWPFFSLPDDGQLVAAGTLGSAYVLDVTNGRVLREIKYPRPDTTQAFAVVDGGKTLLALDDALTLTRIDPRTGQAAEGPAPANRPPPPRHSGRPALAPDGKTLVIDAGGFRLLDSATRQPRWTLTPLPDRRPGGQPGIGPPRPICSADSRVLAVQGPDATVRLVDVPSGRQLRILKSEDYPATPSPGLGAGLKTLAPVALSPDGRWLAVMVGTVSYGDILVVGVASGLELRRFPQRMVVPFLLDYAFSPDGRLLATPGPNGRGVDLWDLESGELHNPAATLPGPAPPAPGSAPPSSAVPRSPEPPRRR